MPPSLHQAQGLKIAVIGGGISGIMAAYLLSRRHQVHLFEQAPKLGGHTHTFQVQTGPDAGLGVDMGFIVLNNRTYPVLNRFLDQLGILRAHTDMSFSFYDREASLFYSGTNLSGLFAQKANLFRPSFWRLLLTIRQFCTQAQKDIHSPEIETLSLQEYLQLRSFPPLLARTYLLPMASAIWSAAEQDVRRFPALNLLRFFDNHGLLSLANRPQWLYLPGGSQTYVRAFAQGFSGHIHTDAPVRRVQRQGEQVLVTVPGQGESRFDAAVLASHADQSLEILSDPTDQERACLEPWTYARNRVVLHTDTSLLCPWKKGWACWNSIREPSMNPWEAVAVHYYMNRLQQLQTTRDYVVSLNPRTEPARESVLEEVVFDHPRYTFEALKTQKELHHLNLHSRTLFCGAYHGYGFHEDGARSGADVAREVFGIGL